MKEVKVENNLVCFYDVIVVKLKKYSKVRLFTKKKEVIPFSFIYSDLDYM